MNTVQSRPEASAALPADSTLPNGRPKLEVAEIMRRFGAAYAGKYRMSPHQARAMRDIQVCRTATLGGHLYVCDGCDYEKPSYNSCNNRSCPKCQAIAQAKWLQNRMARVLPIHYFHVVLTLPEGLRPLTLNNQKKMYDLLFKSASQTLLKLCESPKWMGAQPGITAVLHTWAQDLSYHPHLHCIVTGGGLSPDGSQWRATKHNFLLPVEVLSRLFRGKFLAALELALQAREVRFKGSATYLIQPGAWAKLKAELYEKEWVAYAKAPFGGAESVFAYLGRYTHRTGISNSRIQSISETGIKFDTRDGSVTLEPVEFIRRFLLHVLPPGYMKIRHYGLNASANVNGRLVQARELLTKACGETGGSKAKDVAETLSGGPKLPRWMEWLIKRTGIDPRFCPKCKSGRLERHSLRHDPPPE